MDRKDMDTRAVRPAADRFCATVSANPLHRQRESNAVQAAAGRLWTDVAGKPLIRDGDFETRMHTDFARMDTDEKSILFDPCSSVSGAAGIRVHPCLPFFRRQGSTAAEAGETWPPHVLTPAGDPANTGDGSPSP